MSLLDEKLIDILCDLKNNYCAIGLKAEFEAEGAKLEDVFLLKQFALMQNLDLVVKISGSEAMRDLFDLHYVLPNSIVAPMVESDFALKKFVNATKKAFNNDNCIKYYINIESICGVLNFEKIINSPDFENISGIIIGRGDLAESLGLEKNGVDSSLVSNYVDSIGKQLKNYHKELIVGGGVSAKSEDFLKNLDSIKIHKFETRKVIFDFQKIKSEGVNFKTAIEKAIEFECIWTNIINKSYEQQTQINSQRLQILQERCKI